MLQRPLLGLEHFWNYRQTSLGAGAQSYVNYAGGNHVIQTRAVSNPGRGLATNVWLNYNSQASDPTDVLRNAASPVGPNWTLSVSDLGDLDVATSEPIVSTSGLTVITPITI